MEEKKSSVVDIVFDGIINSIIEGILVPGGKLPTEPELTKTYGVGRNSVREAIKKLEANGVVYIKRGEGTFISESYNHKILDPMLYSIILEKNSWNDFVSLRSVIDIGTLEVIASSNEELDTRGLKRTLLLMEAETLREDISLERLLKYDMDFHKGIAELTGNPQLGTITEYITRLTLPSRRKTTKKIIEDNQLGPFIELHKELLEIIENRQTDKITQTVMNHYIYWK